MSPLAGIVRIVRVGFAGIRGIRAPKLLATGPLNPVSSFNLASLDLVLARNVEFSYSF